MQTYTDEKPYHMMNDPLWNRPVTLKTLHQHLEDAAFCWWRFQKSQWSPLYNCQSLNERIERLDANLEGLRIAGKFAIEPAFERLNRYKSAGDVFVFTYVLIACKAAKEAIDYVTALEQFITKYPHTAQCAGAAILWATQHQKSLSFGSDYLPDLWQLVRRWTESTDHFQLIALPSVLAATPHSAIQVLTKMLCSSDQGVRSSALHLAGDWQVHQLQQRCIDALDSNDLKCRAAASYALVLFGNNDGLSHLRDAIPIATGDEKMRYLLFWSTLSDRNSFTQWLSTGPSTPEQLRLQIKGTALRGDPAFLPFLASCLILPSLSRLAAYAISHITGADIEEINDIDLPSDDTHVEQDISEEALEKIDNSYPEDVGLPIPNSAKLKTWTKNYSSTHNCLLNGKPLTADVAEITIEHGNQLQRWQAGLYLAKLGNWQPWKRLASLEV